MGVGDLLRDLDNGLRGRLCRWPGRLSRWPAGLTRWPASLGRRPTRLRWLAAAALASLAAVLVTSVWAADEEHGRKSAARDLVRVGVVEGQSVPGYLESSRGELADLLRPPAAGGAPVADTYALVTLSAYLGPDHLAGVLAGVPVAEVYARVPMTGVHTQVVRIPAYRLPEDVVGGMLALAERRDREQADYRHLGGTLSGGGAAEDRLRRAYEGAAQVATVEAAAYRTACACVFAAVVRAAPAVLDQLVHRPEVRVVDPAPEVRRLDQAEFRPPLPEEQGVVPKAPSPTSVPAPAGVPSAGTEPSAPGSSRPPALASLASTVVTPASAADRGAGTGPSIGPSGARTDVPSALPPGPNTDVTSPAAGASRAASGR
ncbi:MAG TPA: hypothetical protein VF657_10490 [Actinoplanes sp.]|jgi:hypothetical protein